MGIVAFCTGRPHTCGCSHIQGFMWPHVVVFPTILVEPSLQVSLWNPSSPPCALQRSVKPLDLPLLLRIPHTTPVRPNAPTYHPQRQIAISAAPFVLLPRSPVALPHP